MKLHHLPLRVLIALFWLLFLPYFIYIFKLDIINIIMLAVICSDCT